jgi:malate dehydrogenase
VAQRGTAIIEARGASSAASAANAALDHMRDWLLGSNGSGCRWVSPRPANTTFPRADLRRARHLHPGAIERVGGLELDDFQHRMIQHSVSELVEERDAVVRLLAE